MSALSSIEHTLLKADALPSDIEKLCAESLREGFVGVCVNPCHVPLAKSLLAARCVVVSVLDFPLGAGGTLSVVSEAQWLLDQGADELDLVVPVGAALAGDWAAVERRVSSVRAAAQDKILKVILETGYFTPAQLERVAGVVLAAGADYLKTSTGFGPRGASVDDVRLLVSVAGDRARVKASGGIRDLGAARAMLQAGATRLGTSSGVAIAEQLRRGD